MRRNSLLAFAFAALLASTAAAQDRHHDVALLGAGAFQAPDAIGHGITDRASQAGAFLASYRYHVNRWSAFEVNYGYTRFSQRYTLGGSGGPLAVQANLHEASLAVVFTPPALADERLRPYLLSGLAALVFSPTENPGGSLPGAQDQSRAAWLYGGGIDLVPAPAASWFALRVGYRGLLYKAPSFEQTTLATSAVTHLAEPVVGLVFRF